MDAQVVVNQGAGSVDGAEVEAQRVEIAEAFASAGATCEIAFVAGEQLEAALRRAVAARPDVVVVAGGDGTLGTAAAVLADGDVPLGVLPLGTFNHFAKDMGIPLDPGEAAAAIVGGRVEHVDVGEVNGRCFVNNSSLGVYPVMVGLRDDLRERRGWGKVRAVPVAMWRVLRRFPARRLTISADGYRSTLRTPFVFVGNNRYDVGPRGVGQRSSITGGELCVYIARSASRLRLVGLALRAVVQGSDAVRDLDEHAAPEITVEAGSHRLRVAVDGEVTTMRAPLRYRVRAGALAVRVPERTYDVPTGASTADAAGADAEPRD